ncbi:unnamed protein product [Bursaphelenchus okinawaensis]|uniref:Major facilitator superfamily (MFS) profile domain-containing protein n=1 Tax=Bursaphelenchus okinawaensis TaxID=465554 RepID=A0A811KSX3_9BILA|nr:unnamed protein product [Bursaphelenchus okinawaensis]CAG9111417.1 unnamed protein product [Bursaphelenchus okinawaensis]
MTDPAVKPPESSSTALTTASTQQSQSKSETSILAGIAGLTDDETRILKNENPITKKLIYSLAVIVLGSFQFGYNIGVINASGVYITAFIVENHNETYDVELISLFAAGAVIGALMSGLLADHIGRRKTLHFNNILVGIVAFLMCMAKPLGCYQLFHVGRFVIGLNAGVSSSVVPMYFTEMSPVSLRGSVSSLPQLVVTISILISMILGLPFFFGSDHMWPFLFGIIVVPAIIQSVCLFGVPESPRYSMVLKNDVDRTLEDLIKLRRSDRIGVIECKLLEIERNQRDSYDVMNVITLVNHVEYRWPMFLAAFLMMAQQFCGINAAMFFSTEIYRSAGLSDEDSVYASLGVGIVNVLMTVVSVYLVDVPFFGRRLLMLIGKTGMAFSCLALVVSMYCANNGVAEGVTPYLSCAFLPIYVMFYATGPGSIPFFYVSEIFPSSARASASAVCLTTNWVCTIIVGVAFLPVVKQLDEFTFLIFMCSCIVAAIVIFIFLPETKGRTLDEIQLDMDKRRICG